MVSLARCRSGRAAAAAPPRSRWLGNVAAHVAAVVRIDLAIVVAHAARMNLHHQAVFQAHARHFGEHLGAEEFLLRGIGFARENT